MLRISQGIVGEGEYVVRLLQKCEYTKLKMTKNEINKITREKQKHYKGKEKIESYENTIYTPSIFPENILLHVIFNYSKNWFQE